MPSAFRRSRWERVASPDVVDELAAAYDELDEASQIEASRHVDEVGDADLARELAGRGLPADGDSDVDPEPTGDTPPARGRRRTAE